MRNRPCWNLKRGSSGNGAPDELGGIRSLAAARAAEVARGLALCRVVDRSPAGTSARSLPRETSGLIRTTLIRHQYLHTEQGHEKHHQFGHEAFGQRSRSDGTHSGFRVDFPLFHANLPSVLDLASGLSSGGGRGGKRKGPENFTDQRTAKQGMRITPTRRRPTVWDRLHGARCGPRFPAARSHRR